FCGFRIFPGVIKLSRRRQLLYQDARSKWERLYLAGIINERALQEGYACAFAITRHGDATQWLRRRVAKRFINEV
ncbi:MAG: hypothetical protein AAFN70_17375, partial [Planctomycetota bacterium]